MFTCRACTKRLLSILLEVHLPASALRTAIAADNVSSTRRYATASPVTAKIKTIEHPSESTEIEENEDDGSKQRVSKSTEWAVRKNLEYLRDPLFIAQHVERTLAKGRFEEAALLVRKASMGYKLAVSWNHLIEDRFKNRGIHAALKLFNEMKKRNQAPTAQTYTILFKGCAQSEHKKLAVLEAVKLYNNMLKGPEGRIRPNTIHMNAVLQVCAKAGDLESMFTILQTANDGLRAPTNTTYTTILNALRADAVQTQKLVDCDVDGYSETDAVEASKKMIQRAKAIWNEVMKKWGSASLVLDEALVCSMGRILLLGGYKDNDDILSLIQTTMAIPREESRLLEAAEATNIPFDSTTKAPSQEPTVPALNTVATTQARPGNNTLSLVLSALANTRKTSLAPHYWDMFTKRYLVVPDAQNWHALLQCLRVGKNSAKTAEYLSIMPKDLLVPKNFRTAMKTCLRDNLNKNAFNNATRILEIMLTSIRVPDMQAMRLYLRVAYANKRLFQERAQGDLEGAMLAWGKQLTIALENLWEPYKIAAKQFLFGGLTRVGKDEPTISDREKWERDWKPQKELAALARKMVAAYDRVISENMVPDEVAEELKPRRNSINHFVMKYFEGRQRYEFQDKKGRTDDEDEAWDEDEDEDRDEDGETETASSSRRPRPRRNARLSKGPQRKRL